MTVEEFKNMFPEKSHLEGDELWNAMEDYMLKVKPYIPKPLTDWMGNLVKDGDTVIIIRTRPFFRGEVKSINFQTGEEKLVAYIPDNFQWENIGEYKMKKVGHVLMYDIFFGNGCTLTTSASMIDFGKQPTDVICIKGVSDDKDKYIQFKGCVYSECP
jgi:uncharacterized Zn ribbon protein